MTIVNDNSRVINKLEASLADDARVVIYDCHMFTVHATGNSTTMAPMIPFFLSLLLVSFYTAKYNFLLTLDKPWGINISRFYYFLGC
jgi:hypothetical protein